MISVYVRERYPYSLSEMLGLFGYGEKKELKPFLEKLQLQNIISVIRRTDIYADWSEFADGLVDDDNETEQLSVAYTFNFVGIICFAGRVFFCYPKYLRHGLKPFEEVKQVVKVIEKYSGKTQNITTYEQDKDNVRQNILAFMTYFLQDYYEYGLYRNEQEVVEFNGDGDILWDKTINETTPLMVRETPYYINLYTSKQVHDNSDFFQRLHGCILTSISKDLQQYDLVDILDIVPVDISDETIDDFGNIEYISERLDKELCVQFNTRKQNLLKAMRDYITKQYSLTDANLLTFYGTTSFYDVWEKVCGAVFGNMLHTSLRDLPVKLSNTDLDDRMLIDLIDAPKWHCQESGKTIAAGKTLIPDIATFYNMGGYWHFAIFDGKYYTPQLKGNSLSGIPGVGDITKQYLYQLAFMPYLANVKSIKNCFLMPKTYYSNNVSEDDVSNGGYVAMNMFHQDDVKQACLKDIEVRFLPPHKIYECYLNDKLFPIEELNL